MAKVYTFRGLRPTRTCAEKVAELPYDVVSSEEAAALAKGNPCSFFRISKPEVDLPEGTDPYTPSVYEKGRENLQRFVQDGVLFQEDKPRLYLYRQTMQGRSQTGIVACCSVDDYVQDVIKKHELTRAEKEEDRTRHVDVLGANTGPVFLTYSAQRSLDALVERCCRENPEYDFTSSDGVQHTFWVIDDQESMDEIVTTFGQIPVLYVADGHHRSASAARARDWRRERNPNHTGDEEYNRFLAVLFPHDQLHIMGYHRVVKDLNGLTPEQFMAKVREKFRVTGEGDPNPAGQHSFTMYLQGKWYGLRAGEGTYNEGDPVESLDCDILQKNLLNPVLGIEDPRRDKRVDFVGGIRGTGELERRVDSGEMSVAFALYPVSIEQLMGVADAGMIMPPKSTWFEPKLRSGMVSHLLD